VANDHLLSKQVLSRRGSCEHALQALVLSRAYGAAFKYPVFDCPSTCPTQPFGRTLYIEGHGVPQDYVQAYFWLRLGGPEENVIKAKAHMTPTQISEGERSVKQRKEQHRLNPEIMAAYHIVDVP
jgi:hypothetical protein